MSVSLEVFEQGELSSSPDESPKLNFACCFLLSLGAVGCKLFSLESACSLNKSLPEDALRANICCFLAGGCPFVELAAATSANNSFKICKGGFKIFYIYFLLMGAIICHRRWSYLVG